MKAWAGIERRENLRQRPVMLGAAGRGLNTRPDPDESDGYEGDSREDEFRARWEAVADDA